MSAREAEELVRIARRVAEEAGKLALAAFGRPHESVAHKGAVDLVTATDLAVEELITSRLNHETGFAVLGEEHGRSGSAQGPCWIVDPIDGTTNFANGVPHFAVSIGLWTDEGPTLGVVHAPPARESFWCDGRGAWLDDARLPSLRKSPLADALLASGFPYDRQVNPDNNVALWEAFMLRARGIRRFGAAALDLAWVAAGRVDGFWEPRLRPWDFAAGAALVRAVGGVVTDYHGGALTLDSDTVLAASPALHEEMKSVIQANRTAC